jgi:hypothetical protein
MLVTAGHVTGLLQSKHFCVPQSGEVKPLNCRISRFGHAGVPLAADSIDVSIIHLTEGQADDLSAYHFVQLSEIEYETVLHDPQGYDAFMGWARMASSRTCSHTLAFRYSERNLNSTIDRSRPI